MDIPRKLGVGIVMIVPSFVGGGALWAIFHNWFAVIVWVVIMGFVTSSIVKEKTASI